MFGQSNDYWKEKKAIYTSSEIYQQPSTWKKTYLQVKEKKNEIKAFLDQILSKEDYDIIFTGAGTSEYVGNTVVHYLNEKLQYKVKSYGTTDRA